jgi:hypothetical protein
MIHFIIPLRSSRGSDSWEKVCHLLDATLRSIANQQHAAHTTVLVCHEAPAHLAPGASALGRGRLDIVSVDFDPPARSADREALYAAQERDKYRKMQTGLRHVVDRQRSSGEPAGHVMFVDADDLISNRIAGLAADDPDAAGWYVDRGYTLRADLGRLLPRDGLYLRTNTSHIVAPHLLEPELALPPERLAGDHSALVHRNVRELLAHRGADLRPVPFPGTVYITHHGQNLWADRGKMVGFESPRAVVTQLLGTAHYLLRGRSIPSDVGAEFGMV